MHDLQGTDPFALIHEELVDHGTNQDLRRQGFSPVYSVDARARIVVVGQAPGRRAQASGVPWDDTSGVTLVKWLGVTEEQFRDPTSFAFLPMDFYYPGPGRGGSGDAAPRQDFARRWHPPLLSLMPDVQLTLLIGRFAQQAYLPLQKTESLTEIVQGYQRFLPKQFPLAHPSPLNFRWHSRNPWFLTDVVKDLRRCVNGALS